MRFLTIEGEPRRYRRYLFVAIDRTTRWVYLTLEVNRTARSPKVFLKSVG
ncbi:hypothetical protein [Methylocaldum sp. 14B]|nr:hypothetical protein [Methylocaldum sp. 14B]